MNESSSEPSANSTASGALRVNAPWKSAVSKYVPSLVPVLFGAYILLPYGSVMVPVPVCTTAEFRAGLHHVISCVGGLMPETPNGLVATGRPFGPSELPSATFG